MEIQFLQSILWFYLCRSNTFIRFIMNHHMFTVLLAVFCLVTADFHLPDEEGFNPGLLQPSVLPSTFPFPPVADISLRSTPEFLIQQSVDPLIAQVNNGKLEMYKQALLLALPQLNQLCAILRNCNPTGTDHNSQANQISYNVAALPASMPYPTSMLVTPPSSNYYAAAPNPSVKPTYSVPVPPLYPAPVLVAPAPKPSYGLPAPPSCLTAIPGVSSPVSGYATQTLHSYPTFIHTPPAPAPVPNNATSVSPSYPATTPRAPAPLPSYAIPAPPSYPATMPNALAPLSFYAFPAPPPYPATTQRAPTPMSYATPAPPSYPSPSSSSPAAHPSNGSPAPLSYPATTPRAPARVPSYPAPVQPPYPAQTPRPHPPVPNYAAPVLPSYLANTMSAPASPSYPSVPAAMTPSRPYPITISSTY